MWRKKVRAIWGNADLERRFDQVGPGTVLGLGRVCIREPSRSAAQMHHRLFGNVRAVVVQYDANHGFWWPVRCRRPQRLYARVLVHADGADRWRAGTVRRSDTT